ncbi:bcl-2-like protein 1 [Latimeria chalumnae]|uniref:bcl-2-like protein 1 n=1 Tax=Latimeria chalumnae TaxID=7897 RepID=UPI00313E2654
MSFNRLLVVDHISQKLMQRGYQWREVGEQDHGGGGDRAREAQTPEEGAIPGMDPPNGSHPHAGLNGAVNGLPAGSSSRLEAQAVSGPEAVKRTLREAGEEFELRYSRAFSDLSSQLHITPGTAYQSFEQVVNELFRDGVNWGRVVAFFAFGGALCVESMDKEMSSLVERIAEWMTTYLDDNLNPWIQEQGGWDSFVELYGNNAAAESRRSQELFKWMLTGATLIAGILLGSYLIQKRA